MNIFDMNVHLAPARVTSVSASDQAEKAQGNLKAENELSVPDYFDLLEEYSTLFTKSFAAANFMFFNPAVLSDDKFTGLVREIRNRFSGSSFTALLDFRTKVTLDYLERLRLIGFKGIKFHPYNQKIVEDDWGTILEACKFASSLGFVIFICTSFGTTGMHQHNGLGLACKIAESIQATPIVLLHSGGTRLYEAMLLADACPNVYLETSFTLNYLNGSALLQEFMFIYRKLGASRVCYGSDFPYVTMQDSANLLLQYLEGAQFTSQEIDDIFGGTARRILRI